MSSTLDRSWTVFLLGGASGAGKTSLSYRLARHYGVALTEIDDFQMILEQMTTPEQQPALHLWRTHPAPHTLTVEDILANAIDIGIAMLPALVAVVLNHLKSQTPVVLEGDFLIPALFDHPKIAPLYQSGQVCAAFVHEPDEAQLVENFLRREPESGPKERRAKVSRHYGEWLSQEAERRQIPVLLARPWETTFERLLVVCT